MSKKDKKMWTTLVANLLT